MKEFDSSKTSAMRISDNKTIFPLATTIIVRSDEGARWSGTQDIILRELVEKTPSFPTRTTIVGQQCQRFLLFQDQKLFLGKKFHL